MGLGGICFAVGGTGIKYVRRFILPALLALIALLSGFAWQACLGYAVAQSVTLCLPYGSKTPYWLKFLVFMSYALPSLLLGFTYWQIILPLVCFGAFALSNWKVTAETFAWKIVEFVIGTILGTTIASLISKPH